MEWRLGFILKLVASIIIFPLYTITPQGTADLSIGTGFAESIEENGIALPEAIISYRPANPSVDDLIVFDASNSRGARDIIRCEWDFGDGNSGNGFYVEHRFNTKGIYNVTLTVINDKGAINTSNVNITILTQPGSGFAASLVGSGLGRDLDRLKSI
jgi:hypothetical protein